MENVDNQIQNQGTLGNKQATDFHPTGNQVGAGATTTGAGGGGDFLDKGVDFAGKKAGHPQVISFHCTIPIDKHL
jgi:hypothetical protein